MKKRSLFALLCLLKIWVNAQSLSGVIKNAAHETATGHYALAGELWERAGRLKNSDPELLYKAAECYAQVRDYVRAADCYKVALNDKRFPQASLRFARSLKQQGRYLEAQIAFETFLQEYKGAYRSVFMAVAENELAGCALSLQYSKQLDTFTVAIPLSDSLNTTENEYGPIPFSDKLLYFSRAGNQAAKLMRTRQADRKWGQAEVANALPPEVSEKYRSGSFSSDGNKFYYALCEGGCPAEQGGSNSKSDCSLYCLYRSENGWSAPQKLPDYINLPGSTVMFPSLTQSNGMEYLYFSSDRTGGFGGLDLYVCAHPLTSEALDFSFPQNLGKDVNTGADEVSPFFDAETNTLWFSSMGHPSMGGMDVFKTEKNDQKWTRAQNAGPPINSPADDYFFMLKKDRNGAYLASNRRIPAIKMDTTDDDLFEIWFQR